MRRALATLDSTRFDVVIIGGGITGACIAHDAALRGLSVALVERRDFGGATSSASSKLLHGGVRYLQRFRFDKVRESARERAVFGRIAPHLLRWIPFLIPTDRHWSRSRWPLAVALEWYTLLGGTDERGCGLPRPTGVWLDRAALEREAPAVAARAGVTGAFVLNECHLRSSERMTLAFVRSAARRGAVVANYVEAEDLLREGSRVAGVTVRDVEEDAQFAIRARVTVNAAGPWLARLNDRCVVGPLRRRVTGLARGTHILTRELLPGGWAVALPTDRGSGAALDRGGRHVFIIPWRGRSLIGTSNRPFAGDPGRVAPTPEDIEDLVDDVRAALPSVALESSDVCHAFAGLYPIAARRIDPLAYQATSDYQVIDHGRHGGADGFISALGARYTTARRVAELAVDATCARLGCPDTPCCTAATPLAGGEVTDQQMLLRDLAAGYGDRLEATVLDVLAQHYGTEAFRLLDAATGPEAFRRLVPDRETIEAEVEYAVEHEMARQLADVIFRRTGLGTLGHPGDACLARCAAIMAPRLGWSEHEKTEQLERTRALFPVAV